MRAAMSLLSRILLQAAVALVLLNVVIYFVRAVLASYQNQDMPRLIKPFEVSGGSEDAAKHGVALAHLLSGQLSEIGKQMRASEEALKEAREASKDGKVVVPIDRESLVKPIALPDTVFKPLDLSMSVANVEVGKLLSWIHAWLVEDRALCLSVVYSGDKAVTTGVMNGASHETIWVESTAKDDLHLASDLAYAIAQKPFARAHPEVEYLAPKDFGELLATLQRVATLSQRASRVGVRPADYLDEFNHIKALAETKLPKWPPLLHLAADLPERGEQSEQSLAFYKAELELLDAKADAAGREALQNKILQLEERLGANSTTTVTVAATLTPEAVAQRLLALIGAANPIPDSARTPVIGIVGSPPPANLLPEGLNWTLAAKETGRAEDGSENEETDSYLAALVRTTLGVVPKAKFVFGRLGAATSGGGLTASNILKALNTLVQSDEKVQVIVIPYGPLGGEVFNRTLSDVAQHGIIAVLPAGNDPNTPPPFSRTPLMRQIVVAAAVDLDGNAASFSSRSDDVLWAPGLRIALSSEPIDEMQSGTGFSTAVAAGVAARLVSEHPGRKPDEVIRALRETSQPQADEKVRVINLKAASAQLASLPPTSPTNP